MSRFFRRLVCLFGWHPFEFTGRDRRVCRWCERLEIFVEEDEWGQTWSHVSPR